MVGVGKSLRVFQLRGLRNLFRFWQLRPMVSLFHNGSGLLSSGIADVGIPVRSVSERGKARMMKDLPLCQPLIVFKMFALSPVPAIRC